MALFPLCPQITPKAYGANGIGFLTSSNRFQMQANAKAQGVKRQNLITGHMNLFGFFIC